eukprot:scaffold143282_cov76-Cyclotella_meneghiniana.AAC.2
MIDTSLSNEGMIDDYSKIAALTGTSTVMRFAVARIQAFNLMTNVDIQALNVQADSVNRIHIEVNHGTEGCEKV